MANIALFDLDKTLIRKDTASLFIRYEYDTGMTSKSRVAQVMYWNMLYTMGLMNLEAVAEKVLRWYKGRSDQALKDQTAKWFKERVVSHISDPARAAVARHRQAGDVIAICSGATNYACDLAAQELGIQHVICSELEVADGVLNGKAIRPLCYGTGKLSRAQSFVDRNNGRLDQATFYSDSITDLPLLEAVGTPVAVNPDPRLKRVAERRRWRIEHWG